MTGQTKNAPIPVSFTSGSQEAIREFIAKKRLGPTNVTVFEYDWTKANAAPQGQTGQPHESGYQREIYDHAQGVEFDSYSSGAYNKDYVDDQVQQLQEKEQARHQVVAGTSNVITLTAGGRFTPEIEKAEYLTLSVTHHGIMPSVDNSASRNSDAAKDGYRNQFECLPMDVPFRLDTPVFRPRVHGVEMATVVGPSSEEIETDQHGRVRIWFHWDRKEAKPDSHRWCWARVSQSWSGPGFGTQYIPRIGMEVLVQFVEGDPDRPIVIGCVYNSANVPPIGLPKDKTRSTIRTKTSPNDGSGYNEIRLEDKKSNEEIYIHAQKDMNEVINNIRTEMVGNEEHITVGNVQTIKVGTDGTGLREKTIYGNEENMIKKEQEIRIGGAATHVYESPTSQTNLSGLNMTVTDGDGSGAGEFMMVTDKRFNLNQKNTQLTLSKNNIKLGVVEGGQIAISREPTSVKVTAAGEVIIDTSANIAFKNSANSIKLGKQGISITGLPVVTLNAADTGGPAATGLGDDVDKLAAQSPSLQKDIKQLQAEGWKIEYGTPGEGSWCNKSAKQIVIDGNRKGNAQAVTRVLAHEVGHANYTGKVDYSSKQAYIDSHLADEGEATLNNIKVQREILSNDGPDIVIGGNSVNHPVYNAAYDQYLKDGDAAAARNKIGKQFGTGEESSVKLDGKYVNYNDYYGSDYKGKK